MPDRAHAVIRPERIRIEDYHDGLGAGLGAGHGGVQGAGHGAGRGAGIGAPAGAEPNRVPGMVERLVYVGSGTQVIIRLAAGTQVQALVLSDGGHLDLAQGTPVQVHLPPDALRVLPGDEVAQPDGDLELAPAG